jgi:hypothetical protein
LTYGQILLVRKHQQDGISQLILVQHALEFLSGFDDTITIVAVDDEDDALGVLEIMPPKRSNLVLATDVPHSKLNVLVLDGLNVESYTRVSAPVTTPRISYVFAYIGKEKGL